MDNNRKTEGFAWVTFFAALLVLCTYGYFIYYLIGMADQTDEKVWTRLIFLHAGVEAIVFAAAGFIFGREVNRIQSENEIQSSKDERNAANLEMLSAIQKATAEKTRGEGLAKKIISMAQVRVSNPDLLEKMSNQKQDYGELTLLQMEAFAKKLYPEILT